MQDGSPEAPHDLNTGLVWRRAQDRRPAVHASVEDDDQDASSPARNAL
jgi:hypothetical protein